MSRVIEELVLPIVVRKLRERGALPSCDLYSIVCDQHLSEFFEEQLAKELGAVGETGDWCEAFEIMLEGLACRDPVILEQEIERILDLYISLRRIEAAASESSLSLYTSHYETLAEGSG